MIVLRSHEQVHVLEYSSTKAVFGEHTSYRMLEYSLGETNHLLCGS